MSLFSYTLKRVLLIFPMIIALTFCTYGLMEFAPGDPAEMKLKAKGVIPSEEALAKARAELRLDEPFLTRYVSWLLHAARGDLGTSYKDGRAVNEKMKAAAGYTVLLAVTSLLFTLLLSFPLGILAAVRHDRWPDYLIRFFSFIGNAVPRFLLAVLLIYLFCLRLRLFPVIAERSLQGLFLPLLAMSLGMICYFTRFIRTEVLEQMGRPYVTGAELRGVKKSSVIRRDVLHNAMIHILTQISLAFAGLLGGSIVIESIFRWPGVGKMCMDAISNRDYPVIQGFVLWTGLIYMAVNLITDISYHFLDPRIREE